MNSSWYTAGSRFIRFWSPGKSVASFDISFRSTNRYCLGKTLGSCGVAETPFRSFVSTCEFKQTGVQILRSIVLHFLVLLLRTMELLMDVTHQRLLRSLRVHHLRHRGIRSLRKPLQRGESGNSILRLHVIPHPSPTARFLYLSASSSAINTSSVFSFANSSYIQLSSPIPRKSERALYNGRTKERRTSPSRSVFRSPRHRSCLHPTRTTLHDGSIAPYDLSLLKL